MEDPFGFTAAITAPETSLEPAAPAPPSEFPSVAPVPADGGATAGEVDGTPRPSPGFRVVPPSDIVILPPEPSRFASEPEEDGPPVFRSEFWDEPADGTEPLRFAESVASPLALRDVRETAAAREAIEGGSWLEALERDLFGDLGPTNPPQPPEVPPAKPPETPPPPQEPVPGPEPVEPPAPVEVPDPGPPMPPTPPQPRAVLVEDDESVDVFGRREPRIY